MGIERTFVAIKPDGVKRCLVGEILRRFENSGLKIVGMRMIWVDEDRAREHYAEHVSKPFFNVLKEYLKTGPIVALVLEGVDAIEVVRKIIGSTEPKSSPPGTIRGDFSHHSYKHTDAAKKPVMNLIHASANVNDAKREVALWFHPEDLHDYQTIHEQFTF